MSLNYLHSLFHRIELGWDPISATYAQEYDQSALTRIDKNIVWRLTGLSNGLVGKRVLDLGGGPGHYTILFARAGAHVTWHDISHEYERIAKRYSEAESLAVDFSLGYLEDAKKFGLDAFDLVFCRVCWYYCRSDRAFGRLIYDLLKPGGIGYIECNTPQFSRPNGVRRLQCWLNEQLWWKIGHPLPPHGRIAAVMQKYAVQEMLLDYRSDLTDIVIFVKAQKQDQAVKSSPEDERLRSNTLKLCS